jgi:hypothetical protein
MKKLITIALMMALSGCRVAHYKADERAAYKRQLEIADSAKRYDETHR